MQAHNRSGMRHTIINLLIIAIIVGMYYILSEPQAINAMSASVRYRGRADNAVALECVVDWNAESLESIVEQLSRTDDKITFFVSGSWAADNTKLLRKIKNDGHEIGTLGMNFGDESLDEDSLKTSITDSAVTIESLTGDKVELFYCSADNAGVGARAAKRAGVVCVSSTVDILSGRGESKEIIERAKSGLRQGNIIMFRPTANMKDTISDMLAMIKDMGFNIKKTGEVL